MGLFDSLMAGAQPNPQLGAALQGMPETDPRRLALLRGLGMQPGDAGAQVTGNWMDSQTPPGAPPMPQRPMSPVPGNPSPAAAAVQPTGPAPRNPPGPSGQGAPPLPTVAGNAGPMIPGLSMPPMGQAPSGAPVPASSPLATAGQQSQPGFMAGAPQALAQATGGNPGSMAPPMSSFGGLSAPGDIPAGLQQALTNPQTGRQFSPLEWQYSRVGVSPITAFDAPQTPGGMEAYSGYQRLAEGAANQLLGLHQQQISAQNAGTNRAIGMSEQGRLAAEAFGDPSRGIQGQIANRSQEQENRNATMRDALSRDAQMERETNNALAEARRLNGGVLSPSREQEIRDQVRRTYLNRATVQRPTTPTPPLGAATGNPAEGGAAEPPGGGGGTNQPPPRVLVPGAEAGMTSPLLQDVEARVLETHGEPTGATHTTGPRQGQQVRAMPKDPAKLNTAITDYISRAMAVPGAAFADVNNSAGNIFGHGAMTTWMQRQRGGTGGLSGHDATTLDSFLRSRAAAGAGDAGSVPSVFGRSLDLSSPFGLMRSWFGY